MRKLQIIVGTTLLMILGNIHAVKRSAMDWCLLSPAGKMLFPGAPQKQDFVCCVTGDPEYGPKFGVENATWRPKTEMVNGWYCQGPVNSKGLPSAWIMSLCSGYDTILELNGVNKGPISQYLYRESAVSCATKFSENPATKNWPVKLGPDLYPIQPPP